MAATPVKNDLDFGNVNKILNLGAALAEASGGTGNPSYTAGDMLYASGTTTLAKLAKATATGKVLRGGTSPSWVGSLILLASASPASVASVDFNFTGWTGADFIGYKIFFANLAPATNTVTLRLRTSANGTTFDSGASNYSWTNITGSAVSGGSAGDTSILIGGNALGLGNAANRSNSGEITILRPGVATFCKISAACCEVANDGRDRAGNSSGQRLSAAAVQGAQLLFSSGNIASGDVYLYGMGL